MIINIDRDPKYSLYYIGGVILDLLNSNNKNLSIEIIYTKVKNIVDKNIHIDFIYYSLDWLYMLSLINISENRVILC
ncbi:hypothetical protein EXN65_20770 [Clostridium botulinum]|uniref:ABC-three component system middle component 6 n=1 Tax=Clostridium botulinum TaxID=1491 RepID=UPI00016B972C|nr:ABC-three component system middle component 6 [Clostridium botulinum]EDT83668.1 conserved hypothetical protein [Clostridium botulinum Bf]EDT83686.1 hypothetical protein CBB_A0096 [Clostridium botulinum Bf]EDT83707.1 hypothetical protein CBB_A0075 [Clostridium botulinum Bf]EDT83721.1 hypothetical protein CBB_A0059 [Clostridium botulinum Bf]EDT83745.1 hypothetical protein CBB_2165 [Clostridium botulinum Bf]